MNPRSGKRMRDQLSRVLNRPKENREVFVKRLNWELSELSEGYGLSESQFVVAKAGDFPMRIELNRTRLSPLHCTEDS